MAVIHQISEQAYRELALVEPQWELWDGVPLEKPLMTAVHDNTAFRLGFILQLQLGWNTYRVNVNGGKARVSGRTYFIPDVVVIPAAYQHALDEGLRGFNAFAQPLPLVVEVWSPSTGAYDYARKLDAYRERGDREIWYIHPYDRTLRVWRRRPDNAYDELQYLGGQVPVASLPGVTIDLDALFS